MWGLESLHKLNANNVEAQKIIEREETPEKQAQRQAKFDRDVQLAIQQNINRRAG